MSDLAQPRMSSSTASSTHLRSSAARRRTPCARTRRTSQRYLEWAERTGVDPIALNHRQMRRYLAELDRAGYARRTIARRLSAVRSLFAFLVAEGLAPSDPSSVLADAQDSRASSAARPRRGARRAARAPDDSTLRPACATGRSSSCSTRPARASARSPGFACGDLDLAQGQVTLMGKGSKERLVPMHRKAADRLRALPARRSPELVGEAVRATHVFLSARGLPLSADAIRRIFKRYLRKRRRGALALAARDASHVRHAPPRRRGGPAHRAGASRPCCPVHHPDLYSPEHEAASGRASQRTSARLKH